MRKTGIQPGVIYAYQEKEYRPQPVVFLDDLKTVYDDADTVRRVWYFRPRPPGTTTALGSRYPFSRRGYPAIMPNAGKRWTLAENAEQFDAAVVAALRALNPAAEFRRFKALTAGEAPETAGGLLKYALIPDLPKVLGPWDEVIRAWDEARAEKQRREQAEREAADRELAEVRAADEASRRELDRLAAASRQRADEVVAALAAVGVPADTAGRGLHVVLALTDDLWEDNGAAARLLGFLRPAGGSG
jgi:hypothetical protein